jgi:PTH1 family peptidyl-tRNA hydrolase
VGFLFIRQVARNWKVRVKKRRFQAKIAEVERAQGKILLAIPQTFMNLSGQAVKQIVGGRKIELENLVVVYDDLDIPLGDIRVRKEGSAGTHKGMTSVIQELGSVRFPRIRVGIGPLPAEADAAEYVLSPLAPGERRLIDQALLLAEEALAMILEGQIDEAMNRFNQKGQGL